MLSKINDDDDDYDWELTKVNNNFRTCSMYRTLLATARPGRQEAGEGREDGSPT